MESNTLTIEGERRVQSPGESDKYRRVERGYGAFSRRFTLPNSIDAGKVEASYLDGVLSVKLPRRSFTFDSPRTRYFAPSSSAAGR